MLAEEKFDVLLVEDNPADARLLQEELKYITCNCQISCVCNSLHDALAIIKKRNFRAVLLDLNLSDSRGLQTVVKMHRAASNLPLIALTGIDDEEVGLEAVRKGADDYLVKGSTDGNLLCRTLKYAVQRKDTQTALLRSQVELQQINETLEIRVAERTVEAERRAAQLRALAAELTQAEQKERQRLAQMLHDGLQQLLAGAKFSLGMLGREIEGESSQSLLAELDNILDQSIQASRSLCMELSPPVLYSGTFVEALDWLAQWLKQKYGLNVRVRGDRDVDIEIEDVRVLVFAAVRELLFNTVKHAGVAHADIHLQRDSDGAFEIVVSDKGKGFDPGEIKNRDDFGGTFGLFSINERIKFVGGTFHIESVPGEGTDMIIHLPPNSYLSPKKKKATSPKASFDLKKKEVGAIHVPGANTIRIMLVDDHEMMRKGLADLLEEQPDIEIIAEASNGEAAVKLARKKRPDVIVMDVNMPHMNGIDATRIIHKELPHIKIIALSMYDEADMAAEMRDAGAVNYLHKAGSSDSLIEAIYNCAGRTLSSR